MRRLWNDWSLCDRYDCEKPDFIPGLRGRSFTQHWLQRFQSDPWKILRMRRLLERDVSGQLSRMSDQQVIDRVVALLVSGQVHIHTSQPEPLPVPVALSAAE